MKVGDLVAMVSFADTRENPPTGIIVKSSRPAGHKYSRHLIFWSDGVMSEIPEDILRTVVQNGD